MIGKDIFVQNHRFRLNQDSNKLVIFQSHGSRKTLSLFGAMLIIFNLNVIDDPFLMPNYFQCGIIQSIILMIFIFSLNLLSFFIYFKTWVFGNTFSYEGISSIAISKNIAIIINIILIFSILCITLDMSATIPSNFIDLFTLSPKCPSILLNKWFLYYIINIITIIPALFNNSIYLFYITSAVGNIFLIISVLCFFWAFFKNPPVKFESTFFTDDLRLTANCVTGITNMFFINPLIYLIAINTTSPTTKSIKGMVISTNFASLIFNLVLGIVGYYFHSTIHNVFDIFPKKSVYTIIGKISLIIKLISSNMCYICIISIKLCEIILKGSEKWTVAVVTSGIVVITFNAINLFAKLKNILSIVQFIGKIFQCFLNFGFPTILFLKLFQLSSKPLVIVSIIIMIFTLCLCIMRGISCYYDIKCYNNI